MLKENYFGFDHCKDKKALAFSLYFLQQKGKEDIQVEDTSCIDPPFLNSSSCGQVAGMNNTSLSIKFL